MTNCDPSKLRSQNGQSSFLQEQNSQLSWIRNPGSDGQTLAAEADFLPTPNPISLTDFSYFPDWFFIFSWLICSAFSPVEGSKVCRGQSLEPQLTLWWKIQFFEGCTIQYTNHLQLWPLPFVTFQNVCSPNPRVLCSIIAGKSLLQHLRQSRGEHKLTQLIIFPPLEIAQTYL